MARNDLTETINRNGIRIKHSELLDNYDYHNYAGDAHLMGQAVIKIKSKR